MGYARVSTTEQTLDLQIAALKQAGVRDDNIHVDKISGAKSKRPGLEAALLDCVEGDTLVVWKLDRLGRDTINNILTIDTLFRRGVMFKSLTEGFDFTTPMGKAFAAMLSVFAQFERDQAVERTRAGLREYVARGGKMGPARKLDLEGARQMFREGKSVSDVARHYKVKRQTVYNQFKSPEIIALRDEGLRRHVKKHKPK